MKSPAAPVPAAIPMRDARIDWTKGRVIGFSVADRQSDAFEVVQLHLDGQCVVSGVANRSVFELARDLAGLELPAREHSAFELQIPVRGLHSGMTSDSVVHLEVKTAQGDLIFAPATRGCIELHCVSFSVSVSPVAENANANVFEGEA